MFKYLYLCGLAALLLPTLVSAQSMPAYKLSYGDIVSVRVYGEDDLTMELQLNGQGEINFPFLGAMNVLGMTLTQVQKNITEGLKDGYLVDPRVSVSVTTYRKFYVSGEVKNPGGFAYFPGMTVRQAISLAGGFTPRAAKSKIYVTSSTNTEASLGQYRTTISRKVGLDSVVKPGDVINIKQRFF